MNSRIVSLAKKTAVASGQVNQRTVCIIRVKDSLFIGWNSLKTSPGYHQVCDDGNSKFSRHAEMHALQLAQRQVDDLRKAEVYVMRFLASGGLGLAKPCKGCRDRLREVGIDAGNIFFSDQEGGFDFSNLLYE